MVTRIREYGDKTTIVVFTDDDIVLRKLREWKSCQKVIFYEVWKDCYPRNAVNVAVDLYFNKKEENRIREALGMPSKVKQRSEAQKKQTAKLTEAGMRNRFSSRKTEDAEKVGVFAVKNCGNYKF
ncbi:hypothetical protein ACFLV4_03150 [Chloroflexota bacterium]